MGDRLLSPVPYAAFAVLSWLAAAYLLAGPMPAFGEFFGVCGTMPAPESPYPSGTSCIEARLTQMVHAGMAFLAAVPATAMWVYCAVRRNPAS